MAFKSTLTKAQMKASEEHWKWCKENNIDIWETKLTPNES